MKKRIVIKIIGGAIIFTFAMFFWQGVSTASASSTTLNWDNPNKSGNNPYKFKPQDALNSQLIMQVVGCTGVVDKISIAISNLFQKKTQDAIKALQKKAIIKACTAVKGGAQMGAGTIPNVTITTALGTVIDCNPINNTSDESVQNTLIDGQLQAAAVKKTDECFNGIATTLAKNQLTAMTKYTMNWINSGFNGNPMYVKSITSLTKGIAQGELENGVAKLNSSMGYPYGHDFSAAMITNYKTGASLQAGTTNFLDNLTSDLGSFISNPVSYLPDDKITALKKAQDANDAYAKDFSNGGWDAWLALTQHDQNNLMGFGIQVSEYEAQQQTTQVQATKDEAAQNNGFLSQKTCAKWQIYDKDGNPATPCGTNGKCTGDDELDYAPIYNVNKSSNTPNYDVCKDWNVVTPGSIIKDQLSNFVNSPVRQLEIAKTINDSLNSVFSALISKFQSQGLSSLSSELNTNNTDNIGAGAANAATDLLGNKVSLSGTDLLGNRVSPSSGYTDGSFDLTRDLGNIFIHNYSNVSQGNWNANTNIPELNIGVSPLDDQGNPMSNVFYTVSVAGNTKLITDGYNGWGVGDRAFWDGTSWQNWKKGTANPIANRGVIQIQKDYIVAAKELLANLPAIMPKIGELDYCIPGPNPNWQGNSADAYSTFSDYAYSLTSQYKAGSLLKRDSQQYTIAQPGQDAYDNYKKIFDGTNTFSGTIDVQNTRESAVSGTGTTPESVVTKTEPWIDLIQLSSTGTYKNNTSIGKIADYVGTLLTNISNNLQAFNTQYGLITESIYGSTGLMQKQFIEREDTSELTPNPAWLPMASDGLNITKNIVNYDTDISTTAQGYRDDIIQANANISKLNVIKDQVSVIIKAAQKRRDDNLVKILNDEAKRNGTAVLTPAQYQAKYAECLNEENIVFYEDTDIFTNIGSEAGRCNDGIDNDLNGLVDAKDPACQNLNVANTGTVSTPTATPTSNPTSNPTSTGSVSASGCQINSKIPVKYSVEGANTNCFARSPDVCTSSTYNDGNGQSYTCELLYQ